MGLRTDVEEYFFWEDEEKIAYCQAVLGPGAAAYGGKLKTLQDDDEMHLVGSHGGRSFRLVVDYDSGWYRIEQKLQNRVGVLSLHRDEDKKGGGADEEPDEWDEDDNRELVEFLAPHVYIEEYADEFQAMKQLLERLPPNFRADVPQFMTSYRLSELTIDAGVIRMGFQDEYYKVRLDQHVAYALQVGSWIAGLFEAGDQEVAAKPRVYIGGQPVAGGSLQGARIVTCQYCNGTVQIDAAGRCPNCGGLQKG